MALIRIRAVEPLEGFRLRLYLTNDAVIDRDIRPLMSGRIFEDLLQDPQRFREVRAEGGTVVWSNGADLCPDVLIWGGPPPLAADQVPVSLSAQAPHA
ncbi:hypothetical protein MELA_02554 [Candidatus Methylomirabilis lanthanidiphila]|uniref:DUF2442 domain-containing protein n=1 Tax=Candidatus Methylomirabilis lanthanidiphila TaxID=2211376 RepID=A0A564ZNN4_9BACT|nr:DUF2442 domain-containing protein [Candidatus Methylomirabilis lanthanidiphila]VUZ86158.1 hypothetical protein MELA_02554 [Candidatus Methylomirabilis lanthanidiphila]